MYTQQNPQFAPDLGSKLHIHIPRSRYGGNATLAGAARGALAEVRTNDVSRELISDLLYLSD